MMPVLPTLILAPMQDVTNLAFWKALQPYGGADLYVTEYFRIHPQYRLEPYILDSIRQNPTGRPVAAQLIGNDLDLLAEAATRLQELPIVGIDINLGCPAPSVCGKSCGGALLKEPARIAAIVHRLRPLVSGTLTLKTRVGFDFPTEFDPLLELFSSLPIDGLTIHGRTVSEKYRSHVHTDLIARAVQSLPFPVTANGSVVGVRSAQGMLAKTGAHGLMVGRGAIRNPWIFTQIRQSLSGQPVTRPTLGHFGEYVLRLVEEVQASMPGCSESGLVQRMKKFMNYIAVGLHEGSFLHDIRRAQALPEFIEVIARYLVGADFLPDEPGEEGSLFCGFKALADEHA